MCVFRLLYVKNSFSMIENLTQFIVIITQNLKHLPTSQVKICSLSIYYANFSLKKSIVRDHANSAASLSYRGVEVL